MLIRVIERFKRQVTVIFDTLAGPMIEPNKINLKLSKQRLIQNTNNLQPNQHDSALRNAMWHALRAALRGDKEAQYQMGMGYLYGFLGLERSYIHAEHWLDQAALQGHIAAKQALQDVYETLAFS